MMIVWSVGYKMLDIVLHDLVCVCVFDDAYRMAFAKAGLMEGVLMVMLPTPV